MNSAYEADTDPANPLRPVYWSAVYLNRETERLLKEYEQILERLKLYRAHSGAAGLRNPGRATQSQPARAG